MPAPRQQRYILNNTARLMPPVLIMEYPMPSVKVKENEPVDIAIRRFKRACEKAGVLADVRKKEFFEKPTQERKRKSCRCEALQEKSIS